MGCKQVDIAQGTVEWQEWRSKGIGASDVAAIFGVSPYKTKRDLWFEKSGLGEADDEDRSYIFQRGHETEAEIREMFAKHTKIEMRPTCFENEEIFLASLDGYDKSHGILEAKLVGKEALQKAAAGEIPEHHSIQIQAQLFASESDKAFWGGRAPKVKDGVVVEIGRNEAMIKKIRAEGLKFWEQVQSGKTPDLSAQDILFLTSPEHMALFLELSRLKTQKDQIDEKFEKLEKQAKEFATHSRVRCLNVTITQSERSGAVAWAKIPEVQALDAAYVETFRAKPSKVKTMRFKTEDSDV